MKILCITPVKHIKGVYASLINIGNVLYYPDPDSQTVFELIHKEMPEIIFTNPNKMKFKLDEKLLKNSNVSVICTASTGLNHIDIDYCKQNNIHIISLTKNYDVINKISSTAELSFALLLLLIRNIVPSIYSVKANNWDYEPFIGRQANGMSVGIVGYGRLGKMMAKYCSAFGMRVLICDPFVNGIDHIDLPEIVQSVDILSLHVHLSSATKYMINSNILSLCKDGMYLVNTSRGDVVNEMDVIHALETKKLSGYATDVISDELGDVSKSDILRRMNDLNIVATPHIGGCTVESQHLAYMAAISDLRNFINVY